ncbi:MAG: amidohydrolase [Anaerolineae bacterium]|nr:amidohydrolase [Anaerolineae bacterium]
MIVDAHVHVFPPDWVAAKEHLLARDSYFETLYRGPRGHMASADDLLRSMDEAGVRLSVAAGFGWEDGGLCREQNDYLLECVRRHPERIVGLATVNPARVREAEGEAVRAIEAGLSGIGELMPDGPGYSLDDRKVMEPLARVAESLQVPVLVHVSEPVGHSYPGKGTVAPAQVVATAQAFPSLTLVCAHWGGGLPFYELMPEVARALARVYYDTAAWPLLYRDEVFASMAGVAPHKVLFATDYPLISQRQALQRLDGVRWDGAVREAVLGGNALRVYRGRKGHC